MDFYFILFTVAVVDLIMKTTSKFEYTFPNRKTLKDDHSIILSENNNKYDVQLTLIEISAGSAIITSKFNPPISPSSYCTYTLSKDERDISVNTDTFCRRVDLNSLEENTNYKLILKYQDYEYPISFKTLQNHSIKIKQSDLDCNSVNFINQFTPAISDPPDPVCNSSLRYKDGDDNSCGYSICKMSCSGANFTELFPSTPYKYSIGANPGYTDLDLIITFTTLSNIPYKINVTEITNTSVVIDISGEKDHKYKCTIKVFEKELHKLTSTYTTDGCYGKNITGLSPGQSYDIILEPDKTVYCKTTFTSVSTKYNVALSIDKITTVSANFTATFDPTISDLTRCTYTLFQGERNIRVDSSTLCKIINLDSLEENKNYKLILKHQGSEYSVNFKTLQNHSITITQSNINCTSVSFINQFTPAISDPPDPVCNGSIIYDNETSVSCDDLICKMSCSGAKFTSLSPSTSYKYYIGANPEYTNLDLFMKFTTLSETPYTMNVSEKTNTSVFIDISGRERNYNCRLKVFEKLSNKLISTDTADGCYGKNITGLSPGQSYDIILEPDKTVYCASTSISVSTKYDVEFRVTITTIYAEFNVVFKPKLTEPHSKCLITLHSELETNKRLFDCETVNITNLTPNTFYEVNVTFNDMSYFYNTRTKLNHSIHPKVVNVTCVSLKVCNTFEPSVSNLDTETCENHLESKSKSYKCDGNDCISSCNCIEYINLQSGTDYKYTVSSYPNLTSKSFEKAFNTQYVNPFNVNQTSSQYSTVTVELSSDTKMNFPTCIYMLESVAIRYSRNYTFDNCTSNMLTGLQPKQTYKLTMLPQPNIYCDIIKINVTTSELIRTIILVETKINELVLRYKPPYDDENVHDVCYISVNKEMDDIENGYAQTPCLDIRIPNLFSGTPYIISLKNKYSSNTQNYRFFTKIQDTIYNLKLSLKGTQLIVGWKNNITTNTSISYSIFLFLIDSNSSLRGSEELVVVRKSASSENKTTFSSLYPNKSYKISHCTRPLGYNCTNVSKSDTSCYSCQNESFFVPTRVKYSRNNISYNNTRKYVNITYFSPLEYEFGNITYCFISFALLKQESNDSVDFQDPYQETFVGRNKWKVIKIMDALACSSNKFTVIPLNETDDNNLKYFKPLYYYYYFTVTYCSNVVCKTTDIYDKIYIPEKYDQFMLIIFISFSVIGLILAVISFVIAYKVYKRNQKAEKNTKTEENPSRELSDSRLGENAPTLVSETNQLKDMEPKNPEPVVERTRIFRTDGIQRIQERNEITTMNEERLSIRQHDSIMQDNYPNNSRQIPHEQTPQTNNHESVETAMISEERLDNQDSQDFALLIEDLKANSPYINIYGKQSESDLLPVEEKELIKIVEIDSSFEQMLDTQDDKLKKQFMDLEKIKPESMKQGLDKKNRKLNRYREIIPGDGSLIPLTDENSKERYVNASVIPGKDAGYIAAQGPKRKTITAFYTLICENDVKVVVMVTDFTEDGRHKCAQYLPLDKEICYFGKFEVTQEAVYQYDGTMIYEVLAKKEIHNIEESGIRIRDITVKFNGKTHVFRHFHYTIWPDKSVPVDFESVFKLRTLMREWQSSYGTPILVHGSAGVGRTGTFIAFDYNLCRLEECMDTFNVYGFVSEMRKARPFMVQTYEQYKFIHKLLAIILSRRR